MTYVWRLGSPFESSGRVGQVGQPGVSEVSGGALEVMLLNVSREQLRDIEV